jgi:putative flippase GtrA
MLSAFKNRFIRFCVVGAINTAIDIGVFFLLFYGFGVHLLVANSLGFAAAVVNSYLLNKIWTFEDRGTHSAQRMGLFVLIALGGLGISNLVVYGLADTTGALAAKIFAIAVVLVWNFGLTRKFVFRNS